MGNPEDRFAHDAAQMILFQFTLISNIYCIILHGVINIILSAFIFDLFSSVFRSTFLLESNPVLSSVFFLIHLSFLFNAIIMKPGAVSWTDQQKK